MLTENQKLWVEALRSGKYKQSVDALEDINGGFCCLGVACKIAEEHGVEVATKSNGKLAGISLLSQQNVKLWLGLENNYGRFGNISLTDLNDRWKSFEGIADIIESNPKGLFKE